MLYQFFVLPSSIEITSESVSIDLGTNSGYFLDCLGSHFVNGGHIGRAAKGHMYEIEYANSPHYENSNKTYLNCRVLMIFNVKMWILLILLRPNP